MNYYEHHIGDYAAATAHLSLLEDAIYSRLLRRYYLQEEPLPVEVRQVARLAGARSPEEVEAVEVVLAEFFVQEADGWHNKRADEEVARYQDKRVKAKASANASVAARRGKSDATNAELRSYRMSEARKKGKHTDAEWLALVEFCGAKCVRCGADGHLDRDHIIPVYQGGSDGIENIQPLCPRCNASKGPEDIDHRPNGWQALVERSLSGRSTLQTPDTSNQTEEQKAGARRSPNGSRLPDGWAPSAEDIDFAVAERPEVDWRAEAEKFRDYWHGVAGAKGRKANWHSTWRNWIRRADAPRGARAGPGNVQQIGKTAQGLMALEDFGNGGLDQTGNFGGAEALDVLGPGAYAGSGGHPADRRRLVGGNH